MCKFIGGENPQTNTNIGIRSNSQANKLGINWRGNHNGNKSKGWNGGEDVIPRQWHGNWEHRNVLVHIACKQTKHRA
jgi:hypothetical protein